MPDLFYGGVEPLRTQGVRDYHVHCDYSIDAVGTVGDYCEAALVRNLAEICFTTHFDANPDSDGFANYISLDSRHVPSTVKNLQAYVEDVQRAAEEYYLRGLSVKLGVEFGWFAGAERLATELKETYPFDYMLCGVHELNNLCYCCRSTYQKCFERFSAEEAVAAYFAGVIEAVRTGLFDTIAHLDYYIKYGRLVFGDRIESAHLEYLPELFSQLKKYDCCLEINTSGIRHGTGDYFPRIELVNMAKKAGVAVEYLGSDAHKPSDIGYEFEIAASLVPDTIRGCED